MKRFTRSPRATITTAVLACAFGAQAHAAPPCLLGTSAMSARLVCDQDGCVRPRVDAECALTRATVVRVDRSRPLSLARKRVVRDDVAILLARLD